MTVVSSLPSHDPSAGDPARQDERKLRVLLVEDEWFIAEDIAECLNEAGFEVLGPACTVPDALSLIEMAARDGGIAAAVLDINLQGRMVTPVIEKLQAIGVPMLYMTGYSAEVAQLHCGATPRILKPCDADAVLRGVLALLTAAAGRI